jgi:hypothetical protein
MVWVQKLTAGKLDPHATEGNFVGYDEEAKGHRIYWPKKRTVTVERDVYIDKNAIANPADVVFEGEYPVPAQAGTTSNSMVNEPIEDKCDNTTLWCQALDNQIHSKWSPLCNMSTILEFFLSRPGIEDLIDKSYDYHRLRIALYGNFSASKSAYRR